MSNQKFLHAHLCCKSIAFTYDEGSGSYKAEAGYLVVARIVFCGIDKLGFDLDKIKIIAGLVAGSAAGSVRVYDETNSQVITEITNIVAVTPTIYNSGSLSNLPTDEAIWKVEIQGGSGSTICLESLSFCCP